MVAPISFPSKSEAAAARRKVSRAKQRANRRNAKQSTGPRTPAGKAVSSLNALTLGLFCRQVLLPGEDEPLFLHYRDAFVASMLPADITELLLVERIVAAAWRLNRVTAAESDALAAQMGANLTNDLVDADCLEQEDEDLTDQYETTEERHARRDAAILEYLTNPAGVPELPTPSRALSSHFGESDTGRSIVERMSVHEQRLSNTIHRCLRDLRVAQDLRRAREREWAEQAESAGGEPLDLRTLCPFLPDPGEREAAAAEQDAVTLDEEIDDSTPSPGTPGEGGGEGSRDQRDPSTDDQPRRTLTPPTPGVPGEGEEKKTASGAIRENEPTAEKSVVSSTFTKLCDGPSRQKRGDEVNQPRRDDGAAG